MQKPACDACYKRKIQCHQIKPDAPCDWCHHHNLACTVNRVRGRRQQPKARSKFSVKQSLSWQLEHIEGALIHVFAARKSPIRATVPSITTVSAFSSANSNSQADGFGPPCQHFAGHGLAHPPLLLMPSDCLDTYIPSGQVTSDEGIVGDIPYGYGLAILSEKSQRWVSSKTGETVSFHKFRLVLQPPRDYSLPLSSLEFHGSLGHLYDLPGREFVKDALGTYFRSSIRLIFPLIDPILFDETMTLAYDPWHGQLSADRICAKACVLAFASVMKYFGETGENPYSLDSNTYAAKAFHMLSDMLDFPSVVLLQALVMLHIHQTFSGCLKSAIQLHSIASRLVLKLGGHLYTKSVSHNNEQTPIDRINYQLRMLFWQCYIFDKHITFRTGQPPLMPDDRCDLTPPHHQFNDPSFLRGMDNVSLLPIRVGESTPYFTSDLSLSHLKAKTYRLLYSAQAQSKSGAELLRAIRELDAELENWRMSIPSDFRPALSIPKEANVQLPEMSSPPSMRHISLQLEYHHIIITIHRASERCQSFQSETSLECQWNPGIQSCNNLSLEASRSILIYLRATLHKVAGEAFWLITFYPKVAIMVLFLNILTIPLLPQARSDLELIRSAAAIIRNIPVHNLSQDESSYLQAVDDLVAELIHLTNCAILKGSLETQQTPSENGNSVMGTV
ncbi:hypothetical protein EDB81DRAFT_872478 [Dactylonectria macrodidyma]|uniref:Zn(2)-C6 fungal-type domain-containing protein n=1 Tax=Dactylonectria macrodidyma TaxID=307937 RepID=A0A9P9IM72_9HYPO|nr:hypothetical protein EDB81DRAFT_872478 [Dactylonectria macrodidyma]